MVLFLAVAAASCGTKSSSSEGQSYAEAMKIVCDGAGKDPGYFKANLTNVDVIRFFGSFGDLNPALRARRMHEAIEKAGLTSCPYFDSVATTTPMPTVPDLGLAPLPEAPALVITPNAIVVEGKSIVAVTNGDVDPAEKEGGATGLKIPRVTAFMKALVAASTAKAPSGPPVTLNLFVDPTTPYSLLMSTMSSAKGAPIRTFALAVHAAKATKAIMIVLPDAPTLDPASTAVRMAVAVTNKHILLWSISGQEGSIPQPKLDVAIDRVDDVRKALAEIAERRWPGGKDHEKDILVIADGDVPVQKIAEVMAAVRTTGDGKPLFPDVLLGSGFQ